MKRKLLASFMSLIMVLTMLVPANYVWAAEESFTDASAFQFDSSTGTITGLTEAGKQLTEINIPKQINGVNVTAIGKSAFEYCMSLASVTIPEGVTSIGGEAFYNCSSLTSITIPASVTSIGNGAFSNCISLTSIEMPASVTSIGTGPFGGCFKLKEIIVNEQNPNYLSEEGVLFNKEKTLLIQYPAGKEAVSYDIPTGVTSIGEWAFQGCSSLIKVTIPEGVTSIGSGAFIKLLQP